MINMFLKGDSKTTEPAYSKAVFAKSYSLNLLYN